MEERGYQHLQWQHKDDYLTHDQGEMLYTVVGYI